jgi:fructose-bisphosphate aldolase class II
MLLDPLQSRIVFRHALENRYAILAINADSHAAITDCLEAALQADAPVIIESSLWQLEGHSFGAGDPIQGLARYIASIAVLANSERYKNIPVIYHTDHIKGPKTFSILEAAIKGTKLTVHNESLLLKASTISLDASEFTHEQTIGNICRLCAFAEQEALVVTLEMEDAVDEGITSEKVTTQLLSAVEERYPHHIHLWAPGVGTQHGFGENMNFSPKTIEQQLLLTKKITGREIGIALHGSTGLNDTDLREAAGAGVIKVNWSTESLFIRSNAARRYYEEQKEKLDKKHKEWKNTVMDNGINKYIAAEYLPRVVHRMKLLGAEGRAGSIMQMLNKQLQIQ